MKEEIVRFQNVTMAAGGEQYLDNMNFYMLKGETMGFVASKRKGRDEFLELLWKNRTIEYGRIFIEGREVNSYLHSPGDQNKVYLIGKKSTLIEGLSVTDNVFVIRKGFRKFIINDQVLQRQITFLTKELGLEIDPEKNVSRFTPLERCEVEILKAYMLGCRLIVLVDLSDFIGQRELELFQERIRGLKKKGLSFIYVCNHHEEAFRICDRVSLYSDGCIKKVFEKSDMTDEAIAPYIMEFEVHYSKRKQADTNTKLEFKHVYSKQMNDLSFNLKVNESLTILDTDHVATGEIARILTGEEPVLSGEIFYNGIPYIPSREKDFLKRGIAIIPENPTKTYLFSEQSYMENLTFLLDKKLGKSIVRKVFLKSVRQEYKELAMGGIDETDINRLDIRQKYGLVYFRVLLYHPQLVILVQPVAHGDMICRRYVLELIHRLKDAGITVLILAGSISDNLYVSDRLVVLKNGKSIVEFNSDEFSLITK
ncbi:MAG: sugar ABC transporter ATP-binding protein [Clostridium sp.]